MKMCVAFRPIWFSLIVVLVLIIAPATWAGILKGHPYQDQHFNLDGTSRGGSGTIAAMSQGVRGDLATSVETSTCPNATGTGASAGSSGSSGSRGGVCPPVHNAILRLWVPDGITVTINGHPTRPQTLGGIYRNSRIFSLEGLESNRVSECEIVVDMVDEQGGTMLDLSGTPLRARRGISVQAGGHYEVRFPDGFEQFVPPMEMPPTTVVSEELLPATEGTPTVTADQDAPVNPSPAPVVRGETER